MFTATSRPGRDVSAIRRSWVPSPFPTSRITPPVGRAEASVATSRRQACSASRSEPGPSHSPRFSQPGATARKKSGPMLSYTRAAGFPPCLSTPAACRACWTVQPAIHAGLAAISHPPPTGGFPATGLTTPSPDMLPSFFPGLAPLATAASAWCTDTGALASVRARSANPVWSAWACVSCPCYLRVDLRPSPGLCCLCAGANTRTARDIRPQSARAKTSAARLADPASGLPP